MLTCVVLAAAAAGLVTYADARLATQGSSNVAVYWGEISLVTPFKFTADGVDRSIEWRDGTTEPLDILRRWVILLHHHRPAHQINTP
jgi:hypothetical protein